MKPPLYIGPLSNRQRRRLEKGLRSRDAFTLRRCQILLASARGERPSVIAAHLRCGTQTVRNAIRAFRTDPVGCLRAASSRPNSTTPILDAAACEQLRAIMHESPRAFGKQTTLWTLRLLAAVSAEHQITPHALSIESIRRAFQRIGVRWKRAKHWITSPDPRYALKKSSATG